MYRRGAGCVRRRAARTRKWTQKKTKIWLRNSKKKKEKKKSWKKVRKVSYCATKQSQPQINPSVIRPHAHIWWLELCHYALYTLTLHPAESFVLSVIGAWISWCLWLDTSPFFCFLHWSLMSRFPECSLPSCFIPNPLFWLADRAQLWNSPSQFVSGGNLMSLCPLIIIIVIIIPINVSNSKTRIRLLGGPILQLFWRLWTCYTTGQLTWNCSSNFKNLFGGRPPWTFCFYQENWGRLCEVIESCGEI